jgi:uncharacterized ion transporter superfamily protein YfcC
MAEETEKLGLGRNIVRGFCLLLIMVGLILFLVWGLIFNIWWDVGLYSVLILFFGFGIVGFFLYSMKESKGETGPR